jgi:hypothetical protein
VRGRRGGELRDDLCNTEEDRHRGHQAEQRMTPDAPSGHAGRRAEAEAGHDVVVQPGREQTADEEGREQTAQQSG